MQLVISRDACTGHGRCYTLAPTLVDCDDNGFAVPADEAIEVPADLEALATKLVGSCPEGAISTS